MLPVRLGMIGAGRIWIRMHQPILATLGEVFRPVAFCETNPERRAALAQEFPQAHIVAERAELLALPEVDAVLVLTPLALNASVALAALQAGKHVIMEKPIARTSAEAQTLIDTAQRLQRRLIITEQCGYGSLETDLGALLQQQPVGELLYWDRLVHWPGDSSPNALSFASAEWRRQADFPLGALFDGGIHVIASLSTLFGPPAKVYATGRALREGYGAYDLVTMQFSYANGLVGTLSYSECLHSQHNHFHIHGRDGIISVEGEQLVVSKPEQAAQQHPLGKRYNFEEMWQAIAEAFRTGGEPSYTAARARIDVLTLEAIARSLETGQAQQVTG